MLYMIVFPFELCCVTKAVHLLSSNVKSCSLREAPPPQSVAILLHATSYRMKRVLAGDRWHVTACMRLLACNCLQQLLHANACEKNLRHRVWPFYCM